MPLGVTLSGKRKGLNLNLSMGTTLAPGCIDYTLAAGVDMKF